MESVTVHLKIRRFDLYEIPEEKMLKAELNSNLNYAALKKQLYSLLEESEEDKKVIKIRNKDYILVPLSNLLDGNTADRPFIIDVSKINYNIPTGKSNAYLQDAYLDAVLQKLHSMESRVTEAELLIPQLQWRRQTHMEEVLQNMNTCVTFLNKRIDELMPPQWKSKMPATIT